MVLLRGGVWWAVSGKLGVQWVDFVIVVQWVVPVVVVLWAVPVDVVAWAVGLASRMGYIAAVVVLSAYSVAVGCLVETEWRRNCRSLWVCCEPLFMCLYFCWRWPALPCPARLSECLVGIVA